MKRKLKPSDLFDSKEYKEAFNEPIGKKTYIKSDKMQEGMLTLGVVYHVLHEKTIHDVMKAFPGINPIGYVIEE